MLFSNKYNTEYFGYINSFCKIIVTKQYNTGQRLTHIREKAYVTKIIE